MATRLILFYLGAITVLLCIVPWNQIQSGSDVTASPFVRVFALMGVPVAAHVVNFVVITAAASGMNCNLYLSTRMLFSLARGGYAPESLGRVSLRGTPVRALLASAAGLALAAGIAFFDPANAYVFLLGISMFGGLFTWLIIFVTHVFFLPVKARWRRLGSLAGAASITAILITTWWTEGMRVTLLTGLPWLGLVTIVYFVKKRASRYH
jgi:L-asparagine transporter-like permease